MVVEEHVTEYLAAYALDSLDESEIAQVSEHLARCEVCRENLRAYRATAEQLALAAPLVEPPPEIKEKLMRRVQASSRREQGQRQTWLQRLEQVIRQVTPAWSLASLVLVVGLLASNLMLWRQVRQLNEVNQAATMRVIDLQGTGAAPSATGLIVISMDGEHGTLVVDRLPVLGEDRQYQLWLIRDGQRTSGGIFSVGDDGYGSLWVHAPDPLASYPAFGITIEPFGGSPGPTGERVLGGEL